MRKLCIIETNEYFSFQRTVNILLQFEKRLAHFVRRKKKIIVILILKFCIFISENDKILLISEISQRKLTSIKKSFRYKI